MAVSIMPVGRKRNAGAQVTGDEANAAMTGANVPVDGGLAI
jgi:hypothetical protein